MSVSSRGDGDGRSPETSSSSSLSSGGHGPFSRQQPNYNAREGTFGDERQHETVRNRQLDEEEDQWNSLGPTGDMKRSPEAAELTRRKTGTAAMGGAAMTARELMLAEDKNHEWISPSWARNEGEQSSGGNCYRIARVKYWSCFRNLATHIFIFYLL